MNILELLEGVIRKPASTLNFISQEKPVGWALAIFTASTLLGSLVAEKAVFEQLPSTPATNPVVQIVVSVVGLFIFSGLLHLLSRIFRGTGDYWGLFSALGFAQFPGFLSPIAALIKSGGGIAGTVLGGIVSFGSAVWVMVLYVIGLRESRGITTGAAVLTYIILIMLVALPIIGVVTVLMVKMGLF